MHPSPEHQCKLTNVSRSRVLGCGFEGTQRSAARSLGFSLALNSLPHVQSSATSLFPGQNLWGPCLIIPFCCLFFFVLTIAFYFSLVFWWTVSQTLKYSRISWRYCENEFLHLESESVVCARCLGLFLSCPESDVGCLGKKKNCQQRGSQNLNVKIWINTMVY